VFDTLLGLPVHAIVVHAAVVLVPLMAVLTVLVAVLPRWRPSGAWPVVAGNVVALGAVVVAQQSGEALQRRLPENPQIADHAELGGSMTVFMVGLLVASVLVALLRRRSGALVMAVGALTVVAAVAATAWVVVVGHTGASAVWKDVVANTTPRSGGDE
jgi:hypothetical protein